MKSFLSFFFILVILTISGCSTNAPLKSLYYDIEESISQRNLIVFLRGRGGSHEDFAEKGFVDAIKDSKLPYDMIAPNAHFGYYFGETLVERLKADIINPAKAKGYEEIWLVGASMGGLGALMYSRFYPEDVKGVFVISPFLGYDKIISEIESQGGVRQWEPGEYNPDNDWQRMIWHWLKKYSDNQRQKPVIYLGYGTEDSYVEAQRILGDILPYDQVITTSGGHTPETMKKLWDIFLQRDRLKQSE
ncbi:MAG: pimeloyl-ACP methyl ester carboxylesterase [Desulforhopalus sp.]|jgi:pimeloyl-ACP methyl ester carboxylesterase